MKRIFLIALCSIVLMSLDAGVASGDAQVELRPSDLTDFFVPPGERAFLRLEVENAAKQKDLSYEITDYRDNRVSEGRAGIDGKSVTIPVRVPRGYHTLRFPDVGQEFGITSLPRYERQRDKFFCIDSALSWLWDDKEERKELVRILDRSGIGMSRERLSWGAVNPQPDRWEWNARNDYDALRKAYERIGVDVLELFHSAPGWTGKIGPYPRDLVGTARSWGRIVEHWRGPWRALDVWNAPDIHFGGDLPADQYVSLVKVLAHEIPPAMNEQALLGGGVFAHCNEDYLELAAANGLLPMVDFVSFHTYGRAPGMERLVKRFRDWLRRHDKASMPLWITECGRPWSRGPGRPPTDQGAVSALDITMKGIEARACGVARYFPFVYVYYDERTNNFGMMGRDGTPLRSMVSYANSVRLLAHTEYLGDLRCNSDAVKRARVFGRGDDAVIALYTGEPDPGAEVELPIELEEAIGIDGRALEPSGRRVPVPDGLTYVLVPREKLENRLRKDTTAMRLYREGQRPAAQREEAPPILLQHVPDLDVLSATPEGYTVPQDVEAPLELTIRMVNLSGRHHTVTLSMPGLDAVQRKVHVASEETSTVKFEIPLDVIPSDANYRRFTVSAGSEAVRDILPLAVNLKRTPTLQGLLQRFDHMREIPVDKLNRWEKLAVGGAELGLSAPETGGWRMKVDFPQGVDPWAFPRFRLPEGVDLSEAEGVVIRGRCTQSGIVRMLFWESNDGDLTGVDYMTSESIIPQDGEWHAAFVPLDGLVLNRANEPDPNHRLDLEMVTHLSIGLNSDSRQNLLEVSDLYVVGSD